MNVLVTGGAGYIGSHLVKNLLKENYQVIVFDNLSTGFIEPIEILHHLHNWAGYLEFIKGNLTDSEKLIKVFKGQKIDAVIHLAAKINVIESIQKPELYDQENFLGSVNLLEAMTSAGINKIIFSSTAAVYGDPAYLPIDENHPTSPMNPYAQTKLDFEKYLSKSKNLQYTIFRYFNVGGADPEGLLGRSHLRSEDLIENIMKVVLGQKKVLQIFGNNFETPDGTPIRDFVHVEDVCLAHILALKNIDNPPAGGQNQIFNLGSEKGFSVKEIIDKASLIINKEIPIENSKRREGEIAVSVASAKKAREILGWSLQHSSLEEILRTDWHWRKAHPKGYLS